MFQKIFHKSKLFAIDVEVHRIQPKDFENENKIFISISEYIKSPYTEMYQKRKDILITPSAMFIHGYVSALS